MTVGRVGERDASGKERALGLFCGVGVWKFRIATRRGGTKARSGSQSGKRCVGGNVLLL